VALGTRGEKMKFFFSEKRRDKRSKVRTTGTKVVLKSRGKAAVA